MQPHQKRFAILKQRDLFRPEPIRPEWETLPAGVKRQAAALLAQLIVDIVLSRSSSDQKELIDE